MKLLELRKERDKSQQQIADYLNIKQATYSGYESEKYEPTINTICKLADYYGVSIDYLVGREWNNDMGYLTPEEKELINLIKQLTNTNKIKLMGYLSAMISMQ